MISNQKDISIVIPAYNEAEKIDGALSEIQNFFIQQNRWQKFEVIVVADGCTDRTADIAMQRCRTFPELRVVSYQKNRGKGFAVKTGVKISSGALVAFIDTDQSTPIIELARLAEAIENKTADLVIGSRRMPDSKILIRQPWHRRAMGYCLSLFTRLALGIRFFDTQCGFKLFDGRIARKLFTDQTCPHFGFDLEILSMAICRGYRILEVGVAWRNNSSSSVNPIRDSFRVLVFACKLGLDPLFSKIQRPLAATPLVIYPNKHAK